MIIHYVVFDCEKRQVGTCIGPTDKATIEVRFGKSKPVILKLNSNHRKVLNGSIELLALTDSEACLKLFEEKPDEFFSKLINFHDYGNQAEKALSKDQIVRDSKKTVSIRSQLKSSKGNLLFEDWDKFSKGLARAEKIWAKSSSPEVEVISSGKSKKYFHPKLDIEISKTGSESAKLAVPLFEQILEIEDKGELQSALQNFKPSNKLEGLLKRAHQNPDKKAIEPTEMLAIIRDCRKLVSDGSRRLVEKSLVSIINSESSSDIKKIGFTAAVAISMALSKETLENQAIRDAIMESAREIVKLATNDSDEIWIRNLIRASLGAGYEFSLEKDFDLVPLILNLDDLSQGKKDQILGSLVPWFENHQPTSEAKLLGIEKVLESLGGDFTSSRIALLKLARQRKVKLADWKFFKGLTFDVMLSEPELSFVLDQADISNVIAKDLFKSQISKGISYRELGLVLARAPESLTKLVKWDLFSGFQKQIGELYKRDKSEAYKLIYPLGLEKDLKETSKKYLQLEKQIDQQEKEMSDLRAEIGVKTAEITRLASLLQETMNQNDEVLDLKVEAQVYKKAREFAEFAQEIQMNPRLSLEQHLISDMKLHLKQASIFPKFELGEVLDFDPITMKSLDREHSTGEKVSIKATAFVLVIGQKELLLKGALVQSYMRT